MGSPLESSVEVGRPIEEVFDYLADATNEPKWNRRGKWVKKVSEGPIGGGTIFRGKYQGFGEFDLDLSADERPKRVSYHPHIKQVDGSLNFSLAAIEGGTRVTLHSLVEPKGLMRLMAPLIPLMMKPHVRDMACGIGRELGPIKGHSTPLG